MTPSTSPVLVYTLPGCAHCERARRLLRRRGIGFTEISGHGDAAFRATLRVLTGRSTVPQIVLGGVPVGGASDLARLDRRGVLRPLSEGARFPVAVTRRRLNPLAVCLAPLGGTCSPWKHSVDVVERDGRILHRLPAISGEMAADLAAGLNEDDGRPDAA